MPVKHPRAHLQAPASSEESSRLTPPCCTPGPRKGRRCTRQGACQLAACCRLVRPGGDPQPEARLLSASLRCCPVSPLTMLPASAAESPGAKKGGSIYHKDEDEEGGPLTLHEAAEQGLGKEIARWVAGLNLLHGGMQQGHGARADCSY